MAELISTLADAAAIWLVVLSFVMCLIPLAIAGGMVYGMRKLLKALPPVFDKAQRVMADVARKTDEATDKVASPLIATSANTTRVRASLRSFARMIRREA